MYLLTPSRTLTLSLFAAITMFCCGCAQSKLYPAGYEPRPWVMYVEHDRFFAYPYEYYLSKKHSGDEEFPAPFGKAPTGTVWRSISSIDAFEQEHWRVEGTLIYMIWSKTMSDSARASVGQLFRDRGLAAVTIGPFVPEKWPPEFDEFLESIGEEAEPTP